MFTQVAVVPLDDSNVSVETLLPITAAVQIQVQRDIGPKWGVEAAVSAFASLEDVPPGAWPVVVTTRERMIVDGFHFIMNGLPFGVVGDSEILSVVLSHEIAEMLVDPSGMRVAAGPSLTDGATVDYFVEVCDVCEDSTYYINDVPVSDFILPGYYDHVTARAHGYSFTGKVSAPRQVLPGGYITWREQFPGSTAFQGYAIDLADLTTRLNALARSGLVSIPDPGSDHADINQASGPQLQVLPLPNSPTRAWRELVADVARQRPGNVPTAQPPGRGGKFATTFKENIAALLSAMNDQKPPPSIAEIVNAIANAGNAFQNRVPNVLAPADAAARRALLTEYLKRQDVVAGIFGPDVHPELASWMFMIMP